MKVVILVGVGISVAAAGGCTAETPNATPAAESVGVGAPIPLTPAPASVAAPLVSPVYPSVAASRAYPTEYPLTVFNPDHPHWVIDVFGR